MAKTEPQGSVRSLNSCFFDRPQHAKCLFRMLLDAEEVYSSGPSRQTTARPCPSLRDSRVYSIGPSRQTIGVMPQTFRDRLVHILSWMTMAQWRGKDHRASFL